MIHELQIYSLPGGSVRELERRFGNAIDIRVKYSPLGGFFHGETRHTSEVVSLWPYEGLAQREQVRVAAARDESGRWPPGLGELYQGQIVEILLPAPFMRPLEPQQIGSVWEFTRLDFPPGAIDQVLDAYGRAMPHREEYYPMVGCWSVGIGPIDRLYTLAPFKDLAHRDEVAAALRKDPLWPPKTPVQATGGQVTLLMPSHFSPLR